MKRTQFHTQQPSAIGSLSSDMTRAPNHGHLPRFVVALTEPSHAFLIWGWNVQLHVYLYVDMYVCIHILTTRPAPPTADLLVRLP